jgi:hypothetical protein
VANETEKKLSFEKCFNKQKLADLAHADTKIPAHFAHASEYKRKDGSLELCKYKKIGSLGPELCKYTED